MTTPLPLPCPGVNAKCLTVLMLDAGQGDSTLLIFPDGSLVLVDCGCKKNTAIVTDQIEAVLNAYLGTTGNHLKALVLTHPDGDHYNLVLRQLVNKNVSIGTLIYGGQRSDYGAVGTWIGRQLDLAVGDPNRRIGKARGWNEATQPRIGDKYANPYPDPDLSYVDANAEYNVPVRILAANAGDPAIKTDANPNSIVLLLTYYDINIFLMGDATEETENFILGWNYYAPGNPLTQILRRMNPTRTMLKAGHHGSKTSSSQAWLNLIEPETVLISSDTRTFNGSSIPASAVMDRLRALPNLHDGGPTLGHYFVQYNELNEQHEAVPTTKLICTTLHFLKFQPDNVHFTAYGTSWWYTVSLSESVREVLVNPACSWDQVNNPV